ncbi:MAG: hypothetical protein AAB423_01980 [Patescibacteria group bacterium]
MAINKKLATIGTLGVVGMSSLGFVGLTSAQTSSSGDTLVDKIATKFNLDKDEVKKVFDEEHASRRAEHEKAMSDKLQKLVDEGKLTTDQKSKIESKFKEMKQQREANKDNDLTEEERKAEMEKNHQALEKWAKENKIDLSLIRPDRAGGHGGPMIMHKRD